MTFQSVTVLPIDFSNLKRTMSNSSSAVVEPSPKRVKREVPSFKEIDLGQLLLKDNGKTRAGNGKLVMPLLGSQKLRCNLTPQGFLKAPFGFDVSAKYQKPSFLVGGDAGKSEGLSLVLQPNAEEAEFLKTLDDFFKDAFAKLDERSQWHPLVNEAEKHGITTKVKVVLEGEGLTQIKIVGLDKKVHTGYGWKWLQPFLAENRNFRKSQCKAVVTLTNLWNVSRKAGLTLMVTHLVLVASEKADEGDEDVFDDNALLAELADS